MIHTLATVTGAGIATVQDGGRRGFTEVGVPTSGALHRARYLAATALLSGRPDEARPAIEILSGSLSMIAGPSLVLAAVGPCGLEVDGRRSAVGAAVLVPGGGRVVLSATGPGPAYLVVDGWEPPRVLGSAATDTFSRLGGEVLRAGSRLPGVTTATGRSRIGAFHRPLADAPGPIRVASAGHPGEREFVATAWTVTAAARSGLRLSAGPAPIAAAMPSAPVLPGAIQLTPSGEPIVLGPDGGLTGGYPVVGVVTSVDLDRLSLLAPGDSASFRLVDVAEASAAWRERRRMLRASIAHPDHLP